FFTDHRGKYGLMIGFEVKTIACRHGCIVFHNKSPHDISLFRFWTIRVQSSYLMAQSDTRYFACMTSPRGNRFKIVQYNIILVDRYTIDLLDKFSDRRTHKGFPEVNPSGFTENKT